MSASNLMLTLLILQTILLLEPILLLLFLWLLTYSLVTGTPLGTILGDIAAVEDDILLPHPPGFFDVSDSTSLTGDFSTWAADPDISGTSSLDYSISSTIDSETFCTVSTIINKSASCISETFSENEFDLETVVGMSNKPVEIVPECSSNETCDTDIFPSPGSDKISNISERKPIISDSQPKASISQAKPTPVEASSAPSRVQRCSSESLPHSIDVPIDLDERPVFSRHSVTDNVIFPIRKPPLIPSDSFDINSVLKRMPASWAQKHRRDVPRSLRIAMSGVINTSIFRREEKQIAVGCDAYDSWPYIRTEIEQDTENDEEKVEEDTFVSVLKCAVSTLRK